MAACCYLALDSCLDSPSTTAKFGIGCIADEKLLSKMLFIWCLSINRMYSSLSMPWRISVNNLWIADLAIFREWINNDQRATTTPLLVFPMATAIVFLQKNEAGIYISPLIELDCRYRTAQVDILL